MAKIDLHGIKHEDVQRELDTFFWESMKKNLSQVEVVTGISDKMKSIVNDVAKDYGFNVSDKYFNPGSLIIYLK
jgi:DNA-nicking Smr family endonuclease